MVQMDPKSLILLSFPDFQKDFPNPMEIASMRSGDHKPKWI